jgi:hypothetical protein
LTPTADVIALAVESVHTCSPPDSRQFSFVVAVPHPVGETDRIRLLWIKEGASGRVVA